MKKLFTVITVLLLSFFALPKATLAFEMRSGENLTIPVTEVVDGALFVSGSAVDVAGTVNGDLYCAGQNITISGTVDGDVMCMGQHITIDGMVTGNVRAMAQAITLKGKVDRTVTVMSQDFTIANDSVIGKDLFSMTQMGTVNGLVNRDVGALAEKLFVNGVVGRNMQAGVSALSLGDGSSMGGTLTYWAPEEVQMNPNTTITGPVTFHRVEKAKTAAKTPNFAMPKKNIIWSMVLWLIGGIILVALFPNYGKRLVSIMEQRVGTSMLVGLVTTIIMPFAIVFFLITIIGIPVSMLLAMVFAGVMFLSRLPVAYIVGKQIVRLIVPKGTISRLIPVLVGVPVTLLVFEIPVLGWILAALAGLWGTGGFVMTLKKRS